MLKNLTLKLVMFDSLICTSRVQTISDMKLSNRSRTEYDFVFICSHLFYIVLKTYPQDICKRLCVFLVICEYLSRTVRIRKKFDSLFISCVQPLWHKKVSRDTNAHWIRTMMTYTAGVCYYFQGSQSSSCIFFLKQKGALPFPIYFDK